MKTPALKTLTVGCCAAVIATLQSSCYYKPTEVHQDQPGMSATVTTYRPGYVVNTLPSGYQTRVVRGTTYYTYGSTYFRPHSGGYVVVEGP